MNAQSYQKYARQQAASNWITNMRETGQPVSQQMTNWMGLNQKLFGGSAQDLATLPIYDPNNVDPKQRYVFVVDAPSGIDGAVKKRTDSGKVVWEVPAAGEIGMIQVPVVKAYRVATGEKITQALANAKGEAVRQTEAAAQKAQNQVIQTAMDEETGKIIAAREAANSPQQNLTLQEQRRKVANESSAATAETEQGYRDVAAVNFKTATDAQKQQMNTIQNTLISDNNMEDAKRKQMLEILASLGTNWMHIKFATEELAKLSQLEES
jgi:hypothetical protein